MAIQLNERDHLIFKYVDEHQALLEKQISWFISNDQKPVLIRDRLRKLFYLDYLLCERHKSTLPWWTTPTKPLVYTLSPLARDVISAKQSLVDLSDADIQRHLLEIANLRMLFKVDESSGLISNFKWQTNVAGLNSIDAKASFTCNNTNHQIGIIAENEKLTDETIAKQIESALSDQEIQKLWMVSREDAGQAQLQQSIQSSFAGNQNITNRLFFTTHIKLYKSGIVKADWQKADGSIVSML